MQKTVRLARHITHPGLYGEEEGKQKFESISQYLSSKIREFEERFVETEINVTKYTSEETRALHKKIDKEILKTNQGFDNSYKELNTKYECLSNSLRFDQEANFQKVNDRMDMLKRKLDQVHFLNK